MIEYMIGYWQKLCLCTDDKLASATRLESTSKRVFDREKLNVGGKPCFKYWRSQSGDAGLMNVL